jgi:hypothetical protein
MIRHGWQVEATTLSSQSMDGYRSPELIKMPDGGVEFRYHVRVTRLGAFGHWGGTSKEFGLERRVRHISPQRLVSPLGFPSLHSDSAVWKRTSSPDAIVSESHVVPEAEARWVSGQLVYPDRECFFWSSNYFWYIPPLAQGELPRVALLVEDEYLTPWWAYPLRIILFPLVLFADGVIGPIYIFLHLCGFDPI